MEILRANYDLSDLQSANELIGTEPAFLEPVLPPAKRLAAPEQPIRASEPGEKLIKTGAKVVRHDRHVAFQLVEAAVPPEPVPGKIVVGR